MKDGISDVIKDLSFILRHTDSGSVIGAKKGL